eukprot:11830484-Ditylum_brightwellii.AAC.1
MADTVGTKTFTTKKNFIYSHPRMSKEQCRQWKRGSKMRAKKKQTSIRGYFTTNGTTADAMEGLTKSVKETEYDEVE